MKMSFRAASAGTAAALVLGLAACTAPKPKTPEQVVQQRATERWDALIAGEPARAYNFVAPTIRANMSFEDYQKRYGETLANKARITEVTCEPARCTVRVAMDAKPPVPGMGGMTITTAYNEIWVRQDGQWWYDLNEH